MRQTSKCRKFLADDTWPRRALLWLVLGSICRIRNKWKVRHRARAGQKLSVMMLKTHFVSHIHAVPFIRANHSSDGCAARKKPDLLLRHRTSFLSIVAS